MDYATLREAGIAHIQRLAGEQWTDHNTHDPGITILEQLCYALTDLNYRADFPIEDLMAEDGATAWPDTYRAREMLTSGPVSLQDWRKLILDVEGVKNAWITPVDTQRQTYDTPVYYDEIEHALGLQSRSTNPQFDAPLPLQLLGLYQIEYVLDDDAERKKEDVTLAIKQRFLAHRNLCEDLYKIEKLEDEFITVAGRIEISEVSDPETLLAEIYTRIHRYCTPAIQFYTLQEMVQKGYDIDQILCGPKLQHGYLEDDEVAAFERRKSLRISDIIQQIMDIEGVIAVHNLILQSISSGKAAAMQSQAQQSGKKRKLKNRPAWTLALNPSQAVRLQLPHNLAEDTPSPLKPQSTQGISLWHSGIERRINWTRTSRLFNTLLKEEGEKKKKRSFRELEYQTPLGDDRQVKIHQSIMHQFPDLYGVGINGLPEPSTDKRKAQAKQLKAYLSFFDQLLANAFAQLGSIRSLYGLEADKEPNWTTYFAGSLQDVAPGMREVIDDETYQALWQHPFFGPLIAAADATTDEGHSDSENLPSQILPNQSSPDQIQHENILQEDTLRLRKKRLTHHLLSRFAEGFTAFERSTTRDVEGFLQQYAALSYSRFRAPAYKKGSEHASGLGLRLRSLLGIPEGTPFHLVEHLLLRPGAGDENQKSPMILLPFNGDYERPPLKDPYSLQLSFVFPSWLEPFNQKDFLPVLYQTLREQTPAHLKFYVHLLDEVKMEFFTTAFIDWLTQREASA